MKKISVILAFCVLTLSCEQENSKFNNNNNQQLKLLSENYLADHSEKAAWPWWKILFADVVGAITGGAIGSGAGPAGAAVGALVGGAVASTATAAGIAQPGPIPPDPYTPGVVLSVPNTGNEFDSIGYWHYYTVNKSMLSPTTYTDSNGDFDYYMFTDFAKTTLQDEGVFSSAEIAKYSSNTTDYVKNVTDNLGTKTVEDVINELYTDGKITSDVQITMIDYLECLEASTNLQDFIDYSKAAESIVENSNFSTSDKQIILTAMATARYGVEYWDLN